MATKSTRAPARRKTNPTTSSTKVTCNILFIDSKRRFDLKLRKREQEVDNFLESLDDEEHDLICDYLDVLYGRNKKPVPPELRKVIQFPIGGKRGVTVAKNAL